MPNHVYHTVQVSGDENEVKKFFENHFRPTEDNEGRLSFDFETIVEMPKELKETKFPIPDDFDEEKLNELAQKYGAANWYEWAIGNWGTKWNAYNCDVDADVGQFIFSTAWSTPDPIFEKIAKMYPNIVLDIDVVEEGGFFSGNIRIENGSVEYNLANDNETWRKYAEEILGYDFEEDEE